MNQSHIEEFKEYKTIDGWKRSEITKLDKYEYWCTKLKLEDVMGNTTLQEKIAIEIQSLALYNSTNFLKDEVMQSADNIFKLLNNE